MKRTSEIPSETVIDRLERWASQLPESEPLPIWCHEVAEVADEMVKRYTLGKEVAMSLLLGGRAKFDGHILKVEDI